MEKEDICNLQGTVMQIRKLPANNHWHICAASGKYSITGNLRQLLIKTARDLIAFLFPMNKIRVSDIHFQRVEQATINFRSSY